MRKIRNIRLLTATLLFVYACAATPDYSAVRPAQRGEEWWKKRFTTQNDRARWANFDVVFVGDSLTQGWETAGKKAWERYYAPRSALNLGIIGDRTQHVLWRLDNGNISHLSPRLAVLLIGANNRRYNTSLEIAEGVTAVVEKLKMKFPAAKVLVLGIFPCDEDMSVYRTKIFETNRMLSLLDDGRRVFFLDIGRNLITGEGGTLSRDIMPDFLHLSRKGYDIWAESMEPAMKRLLDEK